MFLSTQNMLKLKDIFKENINIFTLIFLLLYQTKEEVKFKWRS